MQSRKWCWSCLLILVSRAEQISLQTNTLHYWLSFWQCHAHIYHGDNAAGLNVVTESDGILIFRILSLGQEVLLAPEVGLVIDHEHPSLHPTGAALVQVRRDLRAVTDALIRAALEVSLLEEDDLERKTHCCIAANHMWYESIKNNH